MSHDSSEEYESDLSKRTQAEYMTNLLRSVIKPAPKDDLMAAAEKRQLVKKAARSAKRYQHEHKVAVLIAEAVFAILTLSGLRMLVRQRRSRHGKS